MKRLYLLIAMAGCLWPAALRAQRFQQEFGQPRKAFVETVATPDHADSRYQPGEQATLRIVARQGGVPLQGVTLRYKVGPEMWLPEQADSTVFVDGEALVSMGTLPEPGFLACQYEFRAADGKTYKDLVKLAFAPEQIRTFTAMPADFGRFWRETIEEARRVPLEPELTDVADATDERFVTTLVKLHVGRDKWIYGMLTRPRLAADGQPATGKCPVVLCPPGAGSTKVTPSDYFGRQGMVYMKIEIHGNDPRLPDDEYDSLRRARCDGYMGRGMESRDTYYYRDVYAGCVRAVDYLCSLPEWDGHNVIVTGGSQGGALALVTAALSEKVTLCASFYPALCDLTGFRHGRAGGWPKFFTTFYRDGRVSVNEEQAVETLAYYDVVNFARTLRVPVFMSWGYSDDTCSPTSVWAAWNAVGAPKACDVTPTSGHWRFAESQAKCMSWMKGLLK